jgi:hypothetical protein
MRASARRAPDARPWRGFTPHEAIRERYETGISAVYGEQSAMSFEHHEHLRARERQERLLVEARILRLIREARETSERPAPRRESLLHRVFALLRRPALEV